MRTKVMPKIKVADEVWLATALLHRENPSRPDFTLNEIVERVAKEGHYRRTADQASTSMPLSTVSPIVLRTRVDYRMLYETRPKYRRLFRLGDSYDPQREGSKITPDADEIPLRYADLLDWYEEWSRSQGKEPLESDPLLALYGSGKKLWADEHADEYVARLRAGWE